MTKTNAMRLLEKENISYRTIEYEVDESDLSGLHVANQTKIPAEKLFKTLVARGEKNGILVFCVPVCAELELKKAAIAAKDKKIELIHLKELLPLTGYIRGGCSPVGMKKKYPTFFDETILLYDEIGISAGIRGCQMLLSPNDLISYTEAVIADIC